MNIIDVLKQAIHDAYSTGVAWMDYDLDERTISVEWVDGTTTRIAVS